MSAQKQDHMPELQVDDLGYPEPQHQEIDALGNPVRQICWNDGPDSAFDPNLDGHSIGNSDLF